VTRVTWFCWYLGSLLVGGEELCHCHLVLCQCSSLVRADHVDAAFNQTSHATPQMHSSTGRSDSSANYQPIMDGL